MPNNIREQYQNYDTWFVEIGLLGGGVVAWAKYFMGVGHYSYAYVYFLQKYVTF